MRGAEAALKTYHLARGHSSASCVVKWRSALIALGILAYVAAYENGVAREAVEQQRRYNRP